MLRRHGLTLLELIITVAVVAIVSTLAAPSFTHLIYESSRTAAVNGLVHGLFMARMEAARRGQVVTLCRSPDGAQCSADSPWQAGWMVFVNSDGDDMPERGPNEAVLLVDHGWGSGTITSNRRAFSFRPYHQAVVNGTIVFCDPRGSAHARAIIISHTGRARVARRDGSNRALVCS